MSTFLGFGTGVFFGNTVRASTCLIADNLCSTSPGIVIQPIQGAGLGATHLLNSSANPVDVSTSAAPTAGQILIATGATNAVWMDDPGPGDVVGPGASTDNAIARFDGTTGKLIQNSTIEIDDGGNFQGATIKTLASSTSLGRNTGIPPANSTFIGVDVGLFTTGTNNTFIGTDTGSSNNTGSDNTFVGTSAGSGNTTGQDNIFIGQNAGLGNTTESANIYIGNGAGNSATGLNCLLIGRNAGVTNGTNDRLMIDNTGTGTNEPLIDGDFANNTLQINGAVTLGTNGSTDVHRINTTITDTPGLTGTGTAESLPTDPDSWLEININGITPYYIPLYQ